MTHSHTIVLGSIAGLLACATLKACVASANVPASIAAAHRHGPVRSVRELERAGIDMTPAVVLARIAVKEAGFDGRADVAPIARVLTRVGRGDVVLGGRLYSRRSFDRSQLGNRPWIAELNRRATRPASWPAHLSWSAHRNKWLELVSYAHAVLRDRPWTCDVEHWGQARPTSVDYRRAIARGWERVDCGATANAYWRVPRRGR